MDGRPLPTELRALSEHYEGGKLESKILIEYFKKSLKVVTDLKQSCFEHIRENLLFREGNEEILLYFGNQLVGRIPQGLLAAKNNEPKQSNKQTVRSYVENCDLGW